MEDTNPPRPHHGPDIAFTIRMLTERSAILAQRDRLRQFAVESGQPYALHWLPFYLGRQKGRRTLHSLAIVERQDASKSLAGAALFFENRPFGSLPRIGMTEEVVAPAADRPHMVALISEAMIERGLSTVILSYIAADQGKSPVAPFLSQRSLEWAARSIQWVETIRLEPTFHETLNRMSTSARKNLRYYRSRFHHLYKPVFYPDARAALSEDEALQLTRTSKYPVSDETASLRYQTSVTEEGFLMGLCMPDGRWVGAMGGWRAGNATVMQWQANSLSFERDSLVNVLRSHLLEHEIQRGCRSLTILGGTAHRMNSAMDRDERVVFIVRERSRLTKMMGMGAAVLNRYRALTNQPPSTIATRLADPTLRWRSVEENISINRSLRPPWNVSRPGTAMSD